MTAGIGQKFVELTKFTHAVPTDQMKGMPPPPLEMEMDRTRPVIDLPAPQSLQLGQASLREVIDRRRSERTYAQQPISLEELSYLLWCTQGVKQVLPTATLRTVPSAGARHAFETLVAVRRVEGLDEGLYHYDPFEHRLFLLDGENSQTAAITAASYDQSCVKSGAVILVWIAVPQRMNWRYGERGYRYLHLDAGHACQNLYLAAEAIGCGACAIAAFSDEAVNELLGLDGRARFAIYLAAVGRR